MNSLIYGSGFGLYGYLPAIYDFSSRIYLNEKYKTFFNSRNELVKFESKIIWYGNINKIKHKIDFLVIAKRPTDQSRIIKNLIKKKNKIKHLFLEKPISITPKKSYELINILNKKKINYSVGFLFKYTKWYHLIEKKISNRKENTILIKWNIPKKTKLSNLWKYNFDEGGGLIRYYGIHFIKLLSDLNFCFIKKNIIKKNCWELIILDKKNNLIKLILKYSNSSNFFYKINKAKTNKLNNPFNNKINYKSIDPRCIFLRKYIRQNLYNDSSSNMKNFLEFWHLIEKNLSHIV
jgi:hypothetical protein